MSRLLADKIIEAGFRPDIVVAIARGGFVPARIVCDFLGIGELASIRIKHYSAGAAKNQYARLVAPLNVEVRGRKVLIVDDIIDTGDTLQLALDHIRSHGPAAVKTAILIHKEVCSFAADFYAKRMVKWRWVIYPWAVMEDLTGFISRMEPSPESPAEATARLADEFALKVPAGVLKDVYQRLAMQSRGESVR